MTRHLTTLLFVSLCCFGCEQARLDDLDNGRLLVTDNGIELVPMMDNGPWTLVVNPYTPEYDAVVLEELSEYFDDIVFDEVLYLQLSVSDPQFRSLITILGVEPVLGALGSADISWECMGPGDRDCLIFSCAILIDPFGLTPEAFRGRLRHEIGHCPFGLAHDEAINSCMSNPPPFGCEYTDQDLALIEEIWEGCEIAEDGFEGGEANG